MPLATSVLKRLRHFEKLPQFGYATGQAVCNAVMGQVDIAPNDIDIVVLELDYEARLPHFLVHVPATACITEDLPANAGLVLDQCGTPLYTMRKKSKVGLLNFSVVTPATPELSAQQLFAGLDINCVQVAVDLASGEFHQSEAFSDFVESQKLCITNHRNPGKSLLRLLAKCDAMPGTHIDLAAEVLHVLESLSSLGDPLPSKLLPVFEKHKHVLSTHFKLEGATLLRR